jgi:chorismate synthase
LPEKIRIKPLTSFRHFETLLDIQRLVWDHNETDLTPVHQFAVSSRMGGIVLGAFVGGELGGFVYSFPAVLGTRRCQHSHLLAVVPAFRGLGLGKALKWAQRRHALERGYDLITWTFDPLQTRNANLNLQALGAVAATYFHNFYGLTPSLCLGPGIPTDRLLIEWPIRDVRVGRLAAGKGKKACYDPSSLAKALERKAGEEGTFAAPSRPRPGLDADVLLVEVPRDIKALAFRCDLIAAWQTALRRVMTAAFARGYGANHFIFGDRCFYVLKRAGH